MALLCSTFPTVAIGLTLLVLPESPIWLKESGRIEEARVIMKKFRGIDCNSAVPAQIELELQVKQHPKKQRMVKHLLKRSSLLPFTIMTMYFFFQQFSGLFVIVYYAVKISDDAGIRINAYLGAILIGIMRLFGSILVASVSQKFGRRVPSIVSGAGMTIFMGILSVYLYLDDRGHHIGDRGIIPVICILMYIFMSTIGFLVLPFAMIGEIYPAKVKDVLSGVTTSIAYTFSFIAVKTYPDMLTLIGNHGVFSFYATISLLGTIFVAIFLPETKGKTLHELDQLFINIKKKPTNGITADEKIVMCPLKDLPVLA